MEREREALPLLCRGMRVGTVETETEGLYRRFRVTAHLPDKMTAGPIPDGPAEGGTLWRVWLAGEGGETLLGTPEPVGGRLVLSRRLSARSLNPLGPLLRGELRPSSLFSGEEALPLSRGTDQRPKPEVLPRPGGGVLLSYPWAGPFPLPELFCFARLDGGRWVFAFDEAGRPVF